MPQYRRDALLSLGPFTEAMGAEAVEWLKAFLIALVPFVWLLATLSMGVFMVLQSLRLWLSMRALEQRRAMAVLATARYREVNADAIHHFARALSMVRLRFRKWLVRPASSVRFRIDAIGGQGAVFSVTGPVWMRSILEVGAFHGCQLTELDKLDFTLMTAKGMRLGWDNGSPYLLQDAPPHTVPLGLASLIARSSARSSARPSARSSATGRTSMSDRSTAPGERRSR